MHGRTIALCAAAWAVMASPGAFAQAGDQPAGQSPSAASALPHPAKTPGRTKRAAASHPPAPAPARDAYELVPTGKPTSALARARQNAFGTVDDDAGESGRSRGRVGIGMGGANGTTPGMQIGF